MRANNNKNEVAGTYDEKYQRENYFQYSEWMYKRYLAAVARWAGLTPGASVLDAGCGQGFFTNLFSKMGFRATGVDLSAEGIAAARRLYGETATLDFIVGDLKSLDLPRQFDCVFTRSCSLYNDADFPINTATTEILLNHVRKGGSFVFDYHSKLSKRKHSSSWRYHSREDLRSHFGNFQDARTTFSIRIDTLLFGSVALREPLASVSALASQWTGVGGELIAVVPKN